MKVQEDEGYLTAPPAGVKNLPRPTHSLDFSFTCPLFFLKKKLVQSYYCTLKLDEVATYKKGDYSAGVPPQLVGAWRRIARAACLLACADTRQFISKQDGYTFWLAIVNDVYCHTASWKVQRREGRGVRGKNRNATGAVLEQKGRKWGAKQTAVDESTGIVCPYCSRNRLENGVQRSAL